MGIMTRLRTLGFRMPIFTEQFRLTEGLEEILNSQLYGGKLTNTTCTKIVNRLKTREAISRIESTYGIVTRTPHVCLNISPAATLTTRFMGRYNLHNIVVATHCIKAIFKVKIAGQETGERIDLIDQIYFFNIRRSQRPQRRQQKHVDFLKHRELIIVDPKSRRPLLNFPEMPKTVTTKEEQAGCWRPYVARTRTFDMSISAFVCLSLDGRECLL